MSKCKKSQSSSFSPSYIQMWENWEICPPTYPTTEEETKTLVRFAKGWWEGACFEKSVGFNPLLGFTMSGRLTYVVAEELERCVKATFEHSIFTEEDRAEALKIGSIIHHRKSLRGILELI